MTVRLKWRTIVVNNNNNNNKARDYYNMYLLSVRPRKLTGDLAMTGMPRQYT